jgi:hypothetical protein
MDVKHAIEVKDPRARVPPVLAAHCTCGWVGPREPDGTLQPWPARTVISTSNAQAGRRAPTRVGDAEGWRAHRSASSAVVIPQPGTNAASSVSPPCWKGTISAEEGTSAGTSGGRAGGGPARRSATIFSGRAGPQARRAERDSMDSQGDARRAGPPYIGHSRIVRRALAEARRRDAEIALGAQLGVVRIKARVETTPPDPHESEIIARAAARRER